MKVPFYTILKSFLGVFLLCALFAVCYAAYTRLPALLNDFCGGNGLDSASGREVIVTVPKGASVSQVGTILQNNGVIRSRLVFKLVALIRGEQRNIKAGDYLLRTGSDAGDVLDQLISGKTLMISFTVPEGYNLYQIADLFHQTGIMSRDDFLAATKDQGILKEFGIEALSLEGYLFPDTYFLRPSEKGEARLITRKMVQRFKDVYDNNVRETAEKYGWSQAQVVTLASLIEKEARASEHALVSAVFHNRLRINMRLQSDPSVIYGIKPMGAKITRADLDRKHPYNTYQISGLPPGPIANPGKDSLLAAVEPADVDYLYFVSKNDGFHQFSSNLQEHNRWVNLYQKQNGVQTQ